MTTQKDDLIRKIKERIEKDTALLAELTPSYETNIESYANLEARVLAQPRRPKYETGISWLDTNLKGGFTQGSYVNLAGQSFAGKTTLALRILKNISGYAQTVLFSFEMYENILVDELRFTLNDTEKKNLQIVQKGYDLDSIENIIRQKASEGVVFFAIDSKMKIKTNFAGKEYQQISMMSNMLSKLTQELGIILLLINQLSEEDRKSGKFGLKGSGDQQYDSDVVLFLAVEEGEDGTKRRVCYCSKDRFNKKRWKEDVTDPAYSVEVVYQDDEDENITMEQI